MKVQLNGRVTPGLRKRIKADRKNIKASLDVIFFTVFEDFYTRYSPEEREKLFRKCEWWDGGRAAV
jgi:hypothetical protein